MAQVRKQLRRRHGIDKGIPVLMSSEKPRCGLVDMSGGEGNLLDYQVRFLQCPVLSLMQCPHSGTVWQLYAIYVATCPCLWKNAHVKRRSCSRALGHKRTSFCRQDANASAGHVCEP